MEILKKVKDVMKTKNLIRHLQSKGLAIVVLSLIVSACVTAREATWKTVPDSNVPYERAWGIVVNTIAQHFELEISDGQSGYLRTQWKPTPGRESFETSRVHVRVEERSPFRVKVKVEKQENDVFLGKWMITGNNEQMESEIMSELSARLTKG